MKRLAWLVSRVIVSYFFLVTSSWIQASESKGQGAVVFSWFNESAKSFPVLASLSEEDQQVFNGRVRYQDNPAAVEGSRRHYVQALFERLQEAGRATPYTEEAVFAVVMDAVKAMHANSVDVKDKLSARMAAYASLTADEQAAWTRDKYLEHPEHARRVARWWAIKTIKLFLTHNFIANDPRVMKQTEHKLFKDRMRRLEASYGLPHGA